MTDLIKIKVNYKLVLTPGFKQTIGNFSENNSQILLTYTLQHWCQLESRDLQTEPEICHLQVNLQFSSSFSFHWSLRSLISEQGLYLLWVISEINYN